MQKPLRCDHKWGIVTFQYRIGAYWMNLFSAIKNQTQKLNNHDGRFFLAIDTQHQLDRRRYEGTMLLFDGVRSIYGWAIFYRHRGWYKFQRRVRCIRKPTNSTRIIVCVNIPSMDNAPVATIVADIAYMSKAAEGTFICHEDPTSSAISCVDIWYAQKIYFGSTTIHCIRLPNLPTKSPSNLDRLWKWQ